LLIYDKVGWVGGQEEKDLQEGSSNQALSISDYFSGISES